MLRFPERKNSARHRDCGLYGWILYTEEESVKNQEYIQMYRRHGREKGMDIELALYQPVSGWDRQAEQTLCAILQRERPRFAINRTRDYKLAQQLEQSGIRVFNQSKIAELGNDKAKAYTFMEQHGIPILPTWQISFEDRGWRPAQYPVVAKSCRGHGGTEVFLLQNGKEWELWRDAAAGDYVVQQPASESGKDLRVYIINNRIAQAVLRTSEKDFRSNFSLGGQAALYEMSLEERQLVGSILSLVEIDMAAVDFLFDQGRMVFNELEDMAGARMLYALSDYDIVKEYIEHIWRVVSHGLF